MRGNHLLPHTILIVLFNLDSIETEDQLASINIDENIVIIPGWIIKSNLIRCLISNLKLFYTTKFIEVSESTNLEPGNIYFLPETLLCNFSEGSIIPVDPSLKNEKPSLELLLNSIKDQYPVSLIYKNVFNANQNDVVDKEQEKYRSIFDNSLHAIFLTKVDGTILDANKAACEMFGYSLEEIKSLGRQGIIENNKTLNELLKERNIKGSSKGVLIGIRNGGKRFECEYSSTIFIDYKGDEYTSTILVDISQRLEQERAIVENSNFMRMILDNTKESFIILNDELNIVSFNKTAEDYAIQLLGTNIKVGNSILTLANEDSLNRLRNMYDNILAGNSIVSKYSVANKSNITHFKISYTPVNNDEKVVYIMINAKDITIEELALEQINKEGAALQSALEEIEGIMNSSPDLICTLDNSNWNFIRVSSSSKKILGYENSEIIGRSFIEFVDPDDLEYSVNAYNQVRAGINMTNIENCYLHKNGNKIPLIWSATLDSKDNVIYAVAKDATEKIKAEEAILKSEEKYRHLFYSNPIPMWIYDPSTKKFLEVNDAAIIHYGYSREEFLGLTIMDIRPKEDISKLNRIIKSSRGSEFFKHIWKHIKKDGELIDVEINSHVMDYNDQEAVLVSSNDITQKIKLENELIKNNHTVKNILESITDAFLSVNRDWTIIYSNKEAIKLLGENSFEISGQNFWELFKDIISIKFHNKLINAIESKEAVQFEQYLEKSNIWLDITGYPSQEGLSIYFKNISERKLVERQVNSLNKSLERRATELTASNLELENFAYVASHDLQEPLRMITSFLQLFEKKYRDNLDDTGTKYIQFAVGGAVRMNRLILDLLEYSKVGTKHHVMVEVDLNEIINEVLENFSQKVAESNALIYVETLPTMKHAIRSQMYQLFQNLISNALKYQNDNKKPVINISCEEQIDEFIFKISDNGIGIPESFKDKIFVIFQRLHGKNEYSGTGIGLAICKKIVELHGGKIWIDPKVTSGSTFYFSIPKEMKTEDIFN